MPPTATPTPSLRARAAEVRAVVAKLTARRDKTASDSQLARRLFVAFERLGVVHTKGLHFYVFDGAVTVYGSVETVQVRDQALALITSMPGVRQVTEHIQVAQPHTPRKAFSIRPVLFDTAL